MLSWSYITNKSLKKLLKKFFKKIFCLKICESFYIKSDDGITSQNKMVHQNKIIDDFKWTMSDQFWLKMSVILWERWISSKDLARRFLEFSLERKPSYYILCKQQFLRGKISLHFYLLLHTYIFSDLSTKCGIGKINNPFIIDKEVYF